MMDYEENTESMFTEDGIECSLDNQLFDLKKNGHIKSSEDTIAYEVMDEDQELFRFLAVKHHKFRNEH